MRRSKMVRLAKVKTRERVQKSFLVLSRRIVPKRYIYNSLTKSHAGTIVVKNCRNIVGELTKEHHKLSVICYLCLPYQIHTQRTVFCTQRIMRQVLPAPAEIERRGQLGESENFS